MPEPLVLVVDDEPSILRLVALQLGGDGLRVVTTSSGGEALAAAAREAPSLVVLDLVMRHESGLELLGEFKSRFRVRVIVLTARSGESARAAALEAGADLFLTKPFSPEELSGHVRHLLHLPGASGLTPSLLRAGPVEIDLAQHLVTRGAQPVTLSPTEWSLLERLAETAGSVVPGDQLVSDVLDPELQRSPRYLREWIARLQRKLGDDPAHPSLIRPFQDGGYMLAVDAAC
jgi:two-component system KDP operon response regulator KdpE